MLVPPLIPQFLRLVSFKFVATLACAAAMRSMQLEVMAVKKGRQQKLEQQEVERGAAVKGVEPSPKRQRKLWRMGSICSGVAVCHRAADLIASENPGFHVTHVFACEVAPDARKVLSADFPSVRLFGDACEDAGHMPDCDVLVAGFPCQPYSSGNRHRKGSADKRCGVVRAIVEYVKRALPRVVVLENVPGILAWGQDVLLYIDGVPGVRLPDGLQDAVQRPARWCASAAAASVCRGVPFAHPRVGVAGANSHAELAVFAGGRFPVPQHTADSTEGH